MLLARAMSKQRIAGSLCISTKTVNAHVEHIYAKLGVTSRGAAALYAMRHGLISVGDPAD